ncbi:hypothetical protein L218DRAFT_668682 [Marasmius fiardii PR-910]|nr:hypothetical protein L218DRAFT_668682 [Marasmius fiardii PR-910]
MHVQNHERTPTLIHPSQPLRVMPSAGDSPHYHIDNQSWSREPIVVPYELIYILLAGLILVFERVVAGWAVRGSDLPAPGT